MTDEFHVRNGLVTHGDIDILNNKLTTTTTDGDVTLTGNGTGRVKIDGQRFPKNDTGASGKYLTSNGSGDLSWATLPAGGGSGTVMRIKFTVNASNQIDGYDATTVPAGVTVTTGATSATITFANSKGVPAMSAVSGWNSTNNNWSIRHHGTHAFNYTIGATDTTVTLSSYSTSTVGSVSGASNPFWIVLYLI